MREGRRAAVAAGLGDEYLALDGGRGGDRETQEESRLVREEEEVEGEEVFDDHEGHTISFGAKSKEDFARLRKQQIRDELENTDGLVVHETSDIEDEQAPRLIEPRLRLRDAFIPQPLASTTVEQQLAGLSLTLGRLEEDAGHAEAASRAAATAKETAAGTLEQLGSARSAAAERFDYFSRLVNHANSLANLLDEKVPSVEELIESFYTLHVERQTAITNACYSLLDSCITFTAKSNSGPPTLDIVADVAYDPPFSNLTSDDLAETIQSTRDREATLLHEKKTVLADVLNEYLSVAAVLQPLAEWGTKYRSDFDRSYANLTLPDLAKLAVLYDLAGTNPLDEKCDFEDSSWHRDIREHPLNSDTEKPMLEAVVQKFATPFLTRYLGRVDFFLGVHARNAVEALDLLGPYLPPGSPAAAKVREAVESGLGEFLEGFHSRYRGALSPGIL
ncbi:hypothetical protein HK405_012932, partial [Cladochytrium tenue]